MSPNAHLLVDATMGPITVILFGWILSSKVVFGKKQGDALYRIWYLFAAVACITILTLFIAQTEGLFAHENVNDSSLGRYIILLMESYIDLPTEMGILFSVAFIVVAPPSIAYVVSGFYGFAKWSILFPSIVDFLVYSIVKILVFFSAIVFTVIPWNYIHGWSRSTLFKVTCLTINSFTYVGFSFCILSFYLNRSEIFSIISSKLPSWFYSIAGRLHRFLARNW